MTPVSELPPTAGEVQDKLAANASRGDGSGPRSGVGAGAAGATPAKSKRVRTGCLTCRERHLKCDEGLPDCLNCRKSSRECKRGVRLNFIDVQVKKPPFVAPTVEWTVQFQDESRQIASEYQGGLGRYAHLNQQTITPPREVDLEAAFRQQRQHHRGESTDTSILGLDTPKQATTSVGGAYSYPGGSAPRLQSDGNGQAGPDGAHLHSRKSSEAYSFAPPSTSHSAAAGYSLSALQDPFLKDDVVTSRSHVSQHAYHKSDASTSSLVPQVTAPPLSFRAASGIMGGNGQLPPDGMVTPPPSEKATAGEREYLNSPEELLFMQVFVEEVGVWMDSFDKDKHFSRLIPYHALKSPMLLNAFLACGVKHLTLVNPVYKDDKALFYYDTATTQLLRSLQNPDRNTAECATTAVVLNVYEIMSEKPAQRMSHIAGARALIRECGWNAKSTGIGAACFWLNIGMEVLSCLAFNWLTAWDPDQWGVDMDFAGNKGAGGSGSSGNEAVDGAKNDANATDVDAFGQEEIWVHRIFYIVAKIANFRATIPKFQEASPHDEQIRLGNRLAQWQDLKRLCDSWNNCCPRTMHPFGYLYPSQTGSKSAFPNVWLIKRAAVIGRLFYHTAQCLLAQTNPMEPAKASEEMRALQLHHAHQVCGIVAHSKDRGVASVAIRSLAIASCVLTEPKEQEEVLEMLDKINNETGWRLGKVHSELKKAWGWEQLPSRGPSLAAKFFPGTTPSGTPGQVPSLQGSSVGTLSGNHSQSHTPTQQSHQRQSSQTASPANSMPAPQQQHVSQPMAVSAATTVVAPAPMKAPVNPLSFADFSLPNHPYQNWYEPPNRSTSFSSQTFF